EFHRPMKSSSALEQVHAEIRAVAGPWDQDRYFAPDIAAVTALVKSGAAHRATGGLCPSESAR
ncbi:MAG: histidine ammonia-lyase, partial [Caulobacteraceae bacterium]